MFFIIELGSRRVVHFGVTRSPTDEWTAQMERSAVLREATPFGQVPRFLVRDNDSKYADKFTSVAEGSGIEVLRTPYRAPRANAYCERFLGSTRRDCLDHVLIFGERHLHEVIKEYVAYYNRSRPHQGIGQQIPEAARQSAGAEPAEQQEQQEQQLQQGTPFGTEAKIISYPVLGGLHHDYQRVA